MNDADPEQTRWFLDEVQPHENALRAFVRTRFPSLLDVDDLVQDCYARLLKTHSTGPIACPKAFLFVTARNLALNWLRHQRYEAANALEESVSAGVYLHATLPPESVARAEEFDMLMQAIQSLPERCREVVMLRKIYGLSQKEVAARLGISEHTVEVQGVIGLRKCVEYFRRRGYSRRTGR